MNIPLVFTILYIVCVMILAVFGYFGNPGNTFQNSIIEYYPPRVIAAPNGSSVFIIGTVGANAHQNFTNVVINVVALGEQGQIVANKNLVLNDLNSNQTVDYNVSMVNDSHVVTGELRVLNATAKPS